MRRVFLVGGQVIGRAMLSFLLVLMLGSMAWAQSTAVQNGLGWLAGSQDIDGHWPGIEVADYHATSEVLKTLVLLSPASPVLASGRDWLETQASEPTDFLARRIVSEAGAGLDTAARVNALLALGAPSSVWGGHQNVAENILDTARAIQALMAANFSNSTIINPALAFLTTNQNPDGGWGFLPGDNSNVYMTAVVSSTLQQFPQMTIIATAINKATSYLAAHQNIDGGFGGSPSTVHETALAYTALVAVSTDATLLGGAVSYLTATQSANGSWNDDPYSTALALRALHFSEQKPSPPPPPPPGGKITGTVIDSSTTQSLSGVVVVLDSNPLINTTTDSLGNFSLTDVPPGDQLLNFSKSGYAEHTVWATVAKNSVVSLGNVPLLSSYSTGTITGTIRDSVGLPLSEVAISVTGAWSGNAVTGADGSFMFTYVTPGEVTISATKAGYHPLTATGTVFARTTLSVYPRMSTTPPQAGTGSIVGRVVEDHWGLPVFPLPEEEGVTIKVSGGISVTHDDQGYFNIPGLAPGIYQVTVGMNGFASQTFRVVIPPGVTTDLGTIRLVWSFAMTLTGKVTDASTGTPISGAEVAIVGTELAARTDFAGSYVIADIDYPKMTLKASATGYQEKSFIVGKAPWAQRMDISLSPLVTSGGLAGTVVDASSGEPLGGVALTLVGDSSVSASTDSSGNFTFNALPNDAQQIKLSMAGYAQLILTTNITAGTVNNVGKVSLSVDPTSAYIQGTVWDADADAPYPGVEMAATGTGSWQSFTEADGSYKLLDVTPGDVTVTADSGPKPGYYGARFTGTLAPGGVLIFNPVLSTNPPPGILKGTVTDLANNNPIHGAAVTLTPTPAGVGPAFTNTSGAFSVSGVAAGTYKASISAPGYAGQSVSVDIKPGYLGETTITVQLQRYYSSTKLAGKVTDAASGSPIAGAEVSIPGTSKSTVTDDEGNYSLSGIATLAVTIKAAAAGYDSRVFSFRVNAYGEYDVPLALGLNGTSTTTIFGEIREADTNLPITGAEIAVVGGSKSALTDSDGRYSLSGITEMVMDLKVSAPGYDSRYHPLALDAHGDYELLFALTKSRVSAVFINALSTDKPTYFANEPVAIFSEIENTADSTAEITVSAEITDQHGNVLGLVSLPENPVTIDAHALLPASLQWNSEQNPPGTYQVILTLFDHAQGGLLAESRTPLEISPTAAVEGLISLISPKFVNIRATETIGISAYLVNRSNADIDLSAQYEIRNPDGIAVADGTVDFSLAASEAFKAIPLVDFNHTFTKSGQYPVTVKVFSGEVLLAQTADSIYVAPSIRIEPARTLDPGSVIPDGDKDIRIKIQIKGVEEL